MTESDRTGARRRLTTVLEQAEQFRRVGDDGSADAALARAAAIMAKYQIDPATIANDESRSINDVTSVEIKFTGIYRKAASRSMCSVVSELDSVVPIIYTDTRSDTIKIFGYDDDVQLAHVLITSLQLQSLDQVRRWWSQQVRSGSSMEDYKRRRDFVYAFGIGAASRIRTSRNEVISESNALILRSRAETIMDSLASTLNLKNLKMRMLRSSVNDGFSAGYAAGRNAATGETPITNGGVRQIER